MRWVITGSNKCKQSATKGVGMAPRAQYFLAAAMTWDRTLPSVSLRKELKAKPSFFRKSLIGRER